jgi:hypothetical protein
MLRAVLNRCHELIKPRVTIVSLSGCSSISKSFHTQVNMGADCCGADEGIQAKTVEDINGVAESSTTKTHADFLAERQPYYQKRIDLFEKYYQRELDQIEAARAADVKIKVVLPDGNAKVAVKGVTTPMDIAKGISSGLAKKVVVSHVDDKEWDINRPLLGDCALKLFSPGDAEGMDVRLWQSLADG